MSDVVQVLKEARRLIERPEHWTQGARARNKRGRMLIRPEGPTAVQWCARGALMRVTGGTLSNDFWDASSFLHNIANAITGGTCGASGYNDTRTHSEVLALFDAAIAAAEQEVRL